MKQPISTNIVTDWRAAWAIVPLIDDPCVWAPIGIDRVVIVTLLWANNEAIAIFWKTSIVGRNWASWAIPCKNGRHAIRGTSYAICPVSIVTDFWSFSKWVSTNIAVALNSYDQTIWIWLKSASAWAPIGIIHIAVITYFWGSFDTVPACCYTGLVMSTWTSIPLLYGACARASIAVWSASIVTLLSDRIQETVSAWRNTDRRVWSSSCAGIAWHNSAVLSAAIGID